MSEIAIPQPALTDGRVVLRPFREEDIADVVAALRDGDVSRWTTMIPSPYTEDDARSWIESHPERRRLGTGIDLAIPMVKASLEP